MAVRICRTYSAYKTLHSLYTFRPHYQSGSGTVALNDGENAISRPSLRLSLFYWAAGPKAEYLKNAVVDIGFDVTEASGRHEAESGAADHN